MNTLTVRAITPKQEAFLTQLSSERGVTVDTAGMSTREASASIERLLAMLRQTTTATTERPTLVAGRVYTNDRGTFVIVCLSKQGRQYGQIVTATGLVYQAGLLTTDLRLPTEEEAKMWATRYGRCLFCRHEIGHGQDRRSIDRGYGPDCAENQGLPWG